MADSVIAAGRRKRYQLAAAYGPGRVTPRSRQRAGRARHHLLTGDVDLPADIPPWSLRVSMAIRLSPQPSAWLLTGPLVLAGLSNGLVIAPNQDLVLGSVPHREAGAAGGQLITAQRAGAAVGIAVISTVLVGSGSGSRSGGGKVMPAPVRSAQIATVVNLGFILATLLCAPALPRTLSAERADESA